MENIDGSSYLYKPYLDYVHATKRGGGIYAKDAAFSMPSSKCRLSLAEISGDCLYYQGKEKFSISLTDLRISAHTKPS